MKPIHFDDARSSALIALAEIRRDESARQKVLDLVETMISGYQAKGLDCVEKDIQAIRAAAEQLQRIRKGLMEQEIKAVGLFLG